jgi:hypothetical protein
MARDQNHHKTREEREGGNDSIGEEERESTWAIMFDDL